MRIRGRARQATARFTGAHHAGEGENHPVAGSGQEENENAEGSREAEQSLLETAPLSISRFLNLARKEIPALSFAFFLMLLSEATILFIPLLFAKAADALFEPTHDAASKMNEISRIVVIGLIMSSIGMVTMFLRSAIMGVAGERIVARLRNELFSNILKQEIAFFDEHKTGELISRLGSDTTMIQQAMSLAVPEAVVGVVVLVTCIILMFIISAELAGVTTGCITIIFLMCLPFGRVIGRLGKAYQDALGNVQNKSAEALGTVKTVQSFAAEETECVRYTEAVGNPDSSWWPQKNQRETTYGAGFFKSIWSSAFTAFVFGIGNGSLMVTLLWYGFKLVLDRKITAGGVLAFYMYMVFCAQGLAQTSIYAAQIMAAHGASGRVFYLLERVPAIPTPEREGAERRTVASDVENGNVIDKAQSTPLRPESMDGAVEFQGVNFSYPSRPDVPVLRNFSLEVPPNATVAIVGSSGAGKSTVVALLQRFYDVDGGAIAIDGNDIRTLDLKWMRKRIGFVQQEPQLFGMTVRENVCYGVDRDVTDGEIEAVCKEANAHNFVVKWPMKYNTLVGERGVKLSGGQKQRLAIARALLIDPKILLLDEATSALDAESEHLVQAAINRAMVGRTVIVVAHRLSTIKDADKIVMLGEQQIADVGTHEALLRRCDMYQDLIRRQTVGRTNPDVAIGGM